MNTKTKELVRTTLRGRLMLALGWDKMLPQIIFTFFMMLCFIGANLGFDSTMARLEKNKKVLENLHSLYTDTICTLTSLNSVDKTQKNLGKMNSNVDIPTKQAVKLKKEM